MQWEEGRIYDKQAVVFPHCGSVNPGLKVYGTNDKVLIFSPSTEYQPVRRGAKKPGNDRWEEDTIFILFLPVNSPTENSSLIENSQKDQKAIFLFQKSGQNIQDYQYMGEFEYCGNKVSDGFNALRLKSLEYAKKQKKLMEEQRKLIEQKEARDAQIANKISDQLSSISKMDAVQPPKSSSSDRRSSSSSGRSSGSSSSYSRSGSSRYGSHRDSRDSRDLRDSRDRDSRDRDHHRDSRDLRDSRDRSDWDRPKGRDSRDAKDSRLSRFSSSSRSSYVESTVGQPWKDPKEREKREPPPPRRDWEANTMRDLRDAVSTGRSPRDSRDLRSSWGDSRDSGRGPDPWDTKNNAPHPRDQGPPPGPGRDYPPRDQGPPPSQQQPRQSYPPLRDSGPPPSQQQSTFGAQQHSNSVPNLHLSDNRLNTDPYENQPRTPTKEPLDDSWTMYLVNNVIHQQ